MSLLESVPTQPKGGPAWLAPLREKAHAALESGGLPTKKTEEQTRPAAGSSHASIAQILSSSAHMKARSCR